MRTPCSHLLDPYTFCLLSMLYYKTCISICKPNHQDLISCWLESNWASFNLHPSCFQSIYDYLKILNGLRKSLAEPKVSCPFFSFVFFPTLDCTLQPPLLPSSASPVICAPWFESRRFGVGVGITVHGNKLVIAFLPTWWWRAWVIMPLRPLLGGWLAVEPWRSGVTHWLIRLYSACQGPPWLHGAS